MESAERILNQYLKRPLEAPAKRKVLNQGFDEILEKEIASCIDKNLVRKVVEDAKQIQK